MRRVRFAEAARTDFSDIAKWAQAQWGVEHRLRYVARIRAAIDRLRPHSMVGPAYGARRPGLRKLTVGAHIVFYRFDDERIRVVRILDQRMHIEARLAEAPDD
jgi:toxin ParE1/3/4